MVALCDFDVRAVFLTMRVLGSGCSSRGGKPRQTPTLNLIPKSTNVRAQLRCDLEMNPPFSRATAVILGNAEYWQYQDTQEAS